MLDRLLRDHQVIRDKAQALLDLLDSETLPPRELLADTRWKVGSHVMQHLAFEDRHLYAKLLRDERGEVADIGRRFQSELAELFAVYSAHALHWTADRIESDWQAFRVESRKMTLGLFSRIDDEETELFPFARDAQIDLASNAAPVTNWTREAFDIKDAMMRGLHGSAT